jgi:hypothetical protein
VQVTAGAEAKRYRAADDAALVFPPSTAHAEPTPAGRAPRAPT